MRGMSADLSARPRASFFNRNKLPVAAFKQGPLEGRADDAVRTFPEAAAGSDFLYERLPARFGRVANEATPPQECAKPVPLNRDEKALPHLRWIAYRMLACKPPISDSPLGEVVGLRCAGQCRGEAWSRTRGGLRKEPQPSRATSVLLAAVNAMRTTSVAAMVAVIVKSRTNTGRMETGMAPMWRRCGARAQQGFPGYALSLGQVRLVACPVPPV